MIASAPQVQTREGAVPLQWVALQGETASSTADNGDDFEIVPVGDQSLMYTLCGFGDRCSIAAGAPSEERARVLRRESLELALYSFKYVEGVRSVIVLMPPNLGDPADPEDDRQTALFFQKGDFNRELSRPIQQTLAGATPRGVQINTIEQITDRPPDRAAALPLRLPAHAGRRLGDRAGAGLQPALAPERKA